MTESDEEASRATLSMKKGFFSDVLKLVSSATIAQALSILLSPILSRLFSPEAFGTAEVFASILSVISVMVCLSYELAIMLPEKDEDASNLLVGSLIFVGVFTVLTALSVLLLKSLIPRWLGAPDLEPLLWLLPIGVLTNGVHIALRYWNTRRKRFGFLSGVQIASSVSKRALQVGAGGLGYVGPGSLVGSNVFGFLLPAFGLGYKTWQCDKHALLRVNRRSIARLLRRYRKFPLVNSWSRLFSSLSLNIPALLLSTFFTQEVVGLYSLGRRVILLPMTLIANAIQQVFFQRVSVEKSRQGTTHTTVKSVFQSLLLIGLGPLAGISVIAPELFGFVFGKEWVEAGLYMRWMTPWMLLRLISSPISNLISVLERQEVGLYFQVSKLLLTGTALTVGGAVIGEAKVAIALFGMAAALRQGALLLWLLRASNVDLLHSLWQEKSLILLTIAYIGVFLGLQGMLDLSLVSTLILVGVYETLYLLIGYKRFAFSLTVE